MKYVYVDCNKTQEYVFSSRRLRGIRNGSRAIEEAEERVGDLAPYYEGDVIRSLGGIVLVEFPNNVSTTEFVNAAKKIYDEYHIGVEWAEYEHSGDGNFYKKILSPLMSKVRSLKDSPKTVRLPSPSSILSATCDTSGKSSAQRLVKLGNSIERVNASEWKKWLLEKRSDNGQQDKVATKLTEGWTDAGIPKTAEGLISWSVKDKVRGKEIPGTSESRFMGLVFADVNGLGSLLSDFAVTKNRLKEFSPRLKNCIRESLASSMKQVLGASVKKRITKNSRDLAVPFNLLFLGGDDICFAVIGAYAIPLVRVMIEEFEKKSQILLQSISEDGNSSSQLPNYLTMSAGIVLAPYKYPILAFRRLGSELESRAKKLGRAWAKLKGKNYPPSLVDYYLVQNSVIGNLDTVRNGMRMTHDRNGAALFGGPYLASGLPENNDDHSASKWFVHLEELWKSAGDMADMEAGSKLKKLRYLLSAKDASAQYREWWNHLDKQQANKWRNICKKLNLSASKNSLPVNDSPKSNTPILDAVQLMPFYSLTKRWECDKHA